MTSNSITDVAQFRQELVRTLERGYSVDDEENELGVRCIGAAILDHTGRPVAGLSVSAPLQRMSSSRVFDCGLRVAETARTISRGLGHGLLAK
jgi:IclR family acetate operon transcriptional repressor